MKILFAVVILVLSTNVAAIRKIITEYSDAACTIRTSLAVYGVNTCTVNSTCTLMQNGAYFRSDCVNGTAEIMIPDDDNWAVVTNSARINCTLPSAIYSGLPGSCHIVDYDEASPYRFFSLYTNCDTNIQQSKLY
jgi:hypothetical protein